MHFWVIIDGIFFCTLQSLIVFAKPIKFALLFTFGNILAVGRYIVIQINGYVSGYRCYVFLFCFFVFVLFWDGLVKR